MCTYNNRWENSSAPPFNLVLCSWPHEMIALRHAKNWAERTNGLVFWTAEAPSGTGRRESRMSGGNSAREHWAGSPATKKSIDLATLQLTLKWDSGLLSYRIFLGLSIKGLNYIYYFYLIIVGRANIHVMSLWNQKDAMCFGAFYSSLTNKIHSFIVGLHLCT